MSLASTVAFGGKKISKKLKLSVLKQHCCSSLWSWPKLFQRFELIGPSVLPKWINHLLESCWYYPSSPLLPHCFFWKETITTSPVWKTTYFWWQSNLNLGTTMAGQRLKFVLPLQRAWVPPLVRGPRSYAVQSKKKYIFIKKPKI